MTTYCRTCDSKMAAAIHQIEKRNVVVVGKAGVGKSTVCNSILGYEKFEVSSGLDGVTKNVKHGEMEFTDSGVQYFFKVVDTVGLFDPASAKHAEKSNKEAIQRIKTYARKTISEGVSIILFVFREGRYTREESDTFDSFFENFGDDVSDISALVMTGCEQYDEKARLKKVHDFRQNRRTARVARFMGKGIHLVGFPDTSKMKPVFKDAYQEGIETDKRRLIRLIMDSGEMRLSKELFEEKFWNKFDKLHC